MKKKKPEEQEKEHPVATALRQELLTLMQQPLTPKLLSRIARLANAAHSTLDALLAAGPQRRRVGGVLYNPAFAAGYEDGEGSGNYEGVATNGETYGATVARELVSAATQFMHSQAAGTNDPVKTVQAIAAARDAGLTDLEQFLRARLGILDVAEPATAPAPLSAAEAAS